MQPQRRGDPENKRGEVPTYQFLTRRLSPRLRVSAVAFRVSSSENAPNKQRTAAMPGETDLHKTLKKEACRWLFRMGYRCIAAEVRLAPLGIIDSVGTGLFRPYHNYLNQPCDVPQVCF